MGKIFALLGIVFGVIGLLAAIGIFTVLSPLPGEINDLAKVELTRTQATLTDIEKVTTTTNEVFAELENTMTAFSTSSDGTVKAISELGFGLEKIADDLDAALPVLDTSRLKGAAVVMKDLDSDEITTATGKFTAKIRELKGTVAETTEAIGGAKTSLVRVRGTIETATGMMSMFITLFSLFLATISLSLTMLSYGLYKGESGSHPKPKNEPKTAEKMKGKAWPKKQT